MIRPLPKRVVRDTTYLEFLNLIPRANVVEPCMKCQGHFQSSVKYVRQQDDKLAKIDAIDFGNS